MAVASRSAAPISLVNCLIRAVCVSQHNFAHRQCDRQGVALTVAARYHAPEERSAGSDLSCNGRLGERYSLQRGAAWAMRQGVARGCINTVDFIPSPSGSDVESPHCAGADGFSTNATSR